MPMTEVSKEEHDIMKAVNHTQRKHVKQSFGVVGKVWFKMFCNGS